MNDELYTQVDFAKKLSETLGKKVSKQNVGYYKSRGMLYMVSGFVIKESGGTSFLKGDCVSKKDFELENSRVEQTGGEPAVGKSSPLVDYEKSYKLLNKKIDPSHNQKFTSASAPDSRHSNSSISSEAGVFDFNASKARREHYNAELSRMEAEERAGELTNAKEVDDDGYTTAARTRDAMLDIPYHLSATLAAMDDADKIEQLLTNEIEKALRTLSDQMKKEVEVEEAGCA